MMKLRNALNNTKGTGFPLTIAICLVILLAVTAMSEYFRLMIIAEGVRDSLQDAVISTVTENYADVYHSVREGYSGAYQPVSDDFYESINYGDIYGKLTEVHGLDFESGMYVKTKSDGSLEYSLSNLDVEVQNASIRSGDIETQRFEVDGYITLEVPVSFGGNMLPNMEIRIKTTAGYTPKF